LIAKAPQKEASLAIFLVESLSRQAAALEQNDSASSPAPPLAGSIHSYFLPG